MHLFFIPIPKKGNAKECSNYRIIALMSHASQIMLKIQGKGPRTLHVSPGPGLLKPVGWSPGRGDVDLCREEQACSQGRVSCTAAGMQSHPRGVQVPRAKATSALTPARLYQSLPGEHAHAPKGLSPSSGWTNKGPYSEAEGMQGTRLPGGL